MSFLKFQKTLILHLAPFRTTMSSTITDADGFLSSFKAAGGWYDPEVFSLAPFGQMGWGGVSLKDIPVSLRLRLISFREMCRAKLTHCPGTYTALPHPTRLPPDAAHFESAG